MHHGSICVNVVIGVLVVLCELHVTRVVVVVDAVVGLTLGLIAHVVVVVFVVAILHRIFCTWRYTLYNSEAIAEAQLTHLISRDDDAQDTTLPVMKMLRCQTRQQYMTLLHQDALLEEDAANGASVHSLPQVNASVLPAVCVGHDSVMVKRVSNSGAIVNLTNTSYMHIVSMEVLVTIMNCSHSKLEIKMQLARSPANGKPSPRQRQIQKYFCPLLKIQIKPQQLHTLMMSRTCLDVRRHSAWMK